MVQGVQPYYDVVIMGGGPAGSTLGALLARKSSLSVGLFEREVFPREHIGESLVHRMIPVMEESGALPKVLASDCWVQKFGGVFNWDRTGPSVAYFDHANWRADGIFRWSIHVNRSEFDHILVNHASDCGVDVFEGVAVSRFEPLADGCVVTLKDGRQVRASFFVDASGRQNSIATRKKRSWLSGFKNIAIWQHYLGCRPAQTLEGDWNIFREKNISPIGCFTFVDGWCWYIPVPKIIGGERRLTWSIGIVTIPSILKEPGKDYTDPKTFLDTVRRIPLLEDLVRDASPIGDRMITATNYSMINERFANFDERWMLVGDAAYFVDPLFSSGVSFAATMAAAAALILKTTASSDVPEAYKRDLWHDYDTEWHAMAETFALSIDQWYHAIGKNNPESVYWKLRGTTIDLNVREQTFQALLSMTFSSDLLQILARGRMHDLDREGPYLKTLGMADPGEPDAESVLALSPRAAIRESIGLEVPGFKGSIPPPPVEVPPEVRSAIARYWLDPMERGGTVPAPLSQTVPCHRFHFTDEPGAGAVRTMQDREGGAALWDLLRQGPIAYGQLQRAITEPQARLLKRLLRAGIVTVHPVPVAEEAGSAVA